MLTDRLELFRSLVWEHVAKVGSNPSKVTDAIMAQAFPLTVNAASEEGADGMLRNGVQSRVKQMIRHSEPARQLDFASINATYAPIAAKLKSNFYFVESLDEQVPISKLIAEPELLDEARKFMRQKGVECLTEARTLDELYGAVTDKTRGSK